LKKICILWESFRAGFCCCFFILFVVSASACGRGGGGYVGDNDSVDDGSKFEYSTDNNAKPTITEMSKYSHNELVSIAIDLLSSSDAPLYWWLRGWNIDVDTSVPGIKGNDFEYFHPVRRFNTLAEMKSATEQVFTQRFVEKYLYVVLDNSNTAFNTRMFCEFDGQLYFNSFGNGGWMQGLPVDGYVISKNEDNVLLAIVYELPSIRADYTERETHYIRLVKEGGGWRLDSWISMNDEMHDNCEINENIDANSDIKSSPAINGIIYGDVVFNNIKASRLFREPFAEILGPPLSTRGMFVFYEDFELVASGWADDEDSYIHRHLGTNIIYGFKLADNKRHFF